jgi:hypothetical protein
MAEPAAVLAIGIGSPRRGTQPSDQRIDRNVIGLHDYYSGLDLESLGVTANVEIDGIPAGENLLHKLNFKQTSQGVWRYDFKRAPDKRGLFELTVAAKDHQGNLTKTRRTVAIAE